MLNILIPLVILLILIIAFQIAKIFEFIGVIKGEKESKAAHYRLNGLFLLAFMIASMIGIVWYSQDFVDRYLPTASSIHGVWIDEMFNITLLVTGIVFVITEFLLFYFAWRYSYKPGRKALHFADHDRLEIIWTVIPAIVMTMLVIVGAIRWYAITGEAPANAQEIEVTGKQFAWLVRYPGSDNILGKRDFRLINIDNQLGLDVRDKDTWDDLMPTDIHIPVDSPILIRIRSRDVLHAFYIPHLRVKMDAVPGIPTQFWFIPTKTSKQMQEELDNEDFVYEIACAELCGKGHSSMRLLLYIDSAEDYQNWLDEQIPWYANYEPPEENQLEENNNDENEHGDEDHGADADGDGHATAEPGDGHDSSL